MILALHACDQLMKNAYRFHTLAYKINTMLLGKIPRSRIRGKGGTRNLGERSHTNDHSAKLLSKGVYSSMPT